MKPILDLQKSPLWNSSNPIHDRLTDLIQCEINIVMMTEGQTRKESINDDSNIEMWGLSTSPFVSHHWTCFNPVQYHITNNIMHKRQRTTLHQFFSPTDVGPNSPNINDDGRFSSSLPRSSRSSLPSSFSCNDRPRDSSRDLVRIGPCGIIELSTPERLGHDNSDNSDNSDGERRRRKLRRQSAPPVVDVPKQRSQSSKSKPMKRSSLQSSPPVVDVPKQRSKSTNRTSVVMVDTPSTLRSMQNASLHWYGITALKEFQIKAIQSVFDGLHSLIVVPTGAGNHLRAGIYWICREVSVLSTSSSHERSWRQVCVGDFTVNFIDGRSSQIIKAETSKALELGLEDIVVVRYLRWQRVEEVGRQTFGTKYDLYVNGTN